MIHVQGFRAFSFIFHSSQFYFRYKIIPKKFDKDRIINYYDSDNPEELSFLEERFQTTKFFTKGEHTSILKRVRKSFKKTKKDPFAGEVPKLGTVS